RTRIDRLEVSDADVAVERDRQGRFNWDVRKPGEIAGEVAKPEERSELPEFGVVRTAGIALQIVDHAANLRASGVLAAETAADDPQIRISFDGRLQDQPLRIAFVGGPLDTLRAAGEPYPVSLRLEQGETLATAEGRIGEPVRLRGLDLRLSLRGPDLAELLAGLHLPLPKT